MGQRLLSVLNVNVVVGAFNQEKALVGVFSMIVKTDDSFAALILTVPVIQQYCTLYIFLCRVGLLGWKLGRILWTEIGLNSK